MTGDEVNLRPHGWDGSRRGVWWVCNPLPQSFLSGAPSPKKNQGSALAW